VTCLYVCESSAGSRPAHIFIQGQNDFNVAKNACSLAGKNTHATARTSNSATGTTYEALGETGRSIVVNLSGRSPSNGRV
jgi:hypothetical protein